MLKHPAYIEAFIIMVRKYSKSWLARRLHPANGIRNYSLLLRIIDFPGYIELFRCRNIEYRIAGV